MDVFLSRLSYLTTPHELEVLVHSILTKKLHVPFTDKSELCRCTVFEIQDSNGNTECHGLIKITPDTAAQWFIKNANNEKLHGKRLLPHKYVIRDSSWKPPHENDMRRTSLKKSIKDSEPAYISEGMDKFRADH
ncbi:MAG: hypothetical protein A6F70_07675 [Cycloclasticus sp. symbiont of Bathymodiolus heckerae]|nr:MAG: hypothetical protein A6F70_07675 [Cycloclasticus sp. symbiont of Bathymodiolus heckerae]